MYKVRLSDFSITIFLQFIVGSGQSFTAYFYKRIGAKALIPGDADNIPAKGNSAEFRCDPMYRAAVELALGPKAELQNHANEIVHAFLSSGRPTRDVRKIV